MKNYLESVKIGELTFNNRIIVPPMCLECAVDVYVTDDHIITYGMYSRNKYAMIIVEASSVDKYGKMIYPLKIINTLHV